MNTRTFHRSSAKNVEYYNTNNWLGLRLSVLIMAGLLSIFIAYGVAVSNPQSPMAGNILGIVAGLATWFTAFAWFVVTEQL